MASTTCLQSSSINTLDRPILPNHFTASFKPFAFASCGCGNSKKQVVFAFINSSQASSDAHAYSITPLFLEDCYIDIALDLSHLQFAPIVMIMAYCSVRVAFSFLPAL